MSIYIVTGTPGAGKTYFTTRKIALSIMKGKYVATNVKLVDDWPERIADQVPFIRVRGKRFRQELIDSWQRKLVQVDSIGELARVRLSTDGLKPSQMEGRGVAVFDEAGDELDARESVGADRDQRAKRKRDQRFARQHRKLGWDLFFVAQEAEQIDARIRGMAEYEVILRNLKHLKVKVPILPIRFKPFPGNCFVAVTSWLVVSDHMAGREMYRLNKGLAGLYDTYQLVQDPQHPDDDLIWLPRADGDPQRAAPALAVRCTNDHAPPVPQTQLTPAAPVPHPLRGVAPVSSPLGVPASNGASPPRPGAAHVVQPAGAAGSRPPSSVPAVSAIPSAPALILPQIGHAPNNAQDPAGQPGLALESRESARDASAGS